MLVGDLIVDLAFIADIALSFRTVVTYEERGEEMRPVVHAVCHTR